MERSGRTAAEQQAQSRAAEQRGATAVEQTPGPLAGEQPAEVEPGIGIKSDGQPFEQQECRSELGGRTLVGFKPDAYAAALA